MDFTVNYEVKEVISALNKFIETEVVPLQEKYKHELENERKTFGKTIGNHQAIPKMLAECAIDIYAGHNILLNCAWKMENQSELPIKEILIIKAFCTEMAQRVIDKCMQIHGGMGLTNELKLEKAWRWARMMRIPDGTTEIQKRIIAKKMLQGDLHF